MSEPQVGLRERTPAERHRAVAGRFGAVVAGVGDWSAPTPVPEWRAIDVVRHLVEWFPAFLAAGGVALPPASPVEDDPGRAWAERAASIQALLDDPERAAAELVHPQVGAHPLAEAVDRFYTADAFMHTWDLARAVGADDELDPGWAAELLAGMEPLDEVLRSSGHYGPRVPVGDDADPTRRLMAFVGRDPDWVPPGA